MDKAMLLQAPERREWRWIGLVSLGAGLYSSQIILTRLIHGLDPLSISFYRALFAFLFFAALVFRFRQPLQSAQYQGALGRLVFMGIATGLTAALYMYAIQHTTAANASLLVNTTPIYVAILAPFVLKEARPRFTWLCLGLILLGVGLITGVSGLRVGVEDLLGVLAGTCAGLVYAIYMLAVRSLHGKIDGFTQLLWALGIASLVLLPWALRVPLQNVLVNLPFLLALSLLSAGLANFLFLISLQKLKVQVVSVVAILEPVGGVLIGWLVYQERPDLPSTLGSLLILISIYLITR